MISQLKLPRLAGNAVLVDEQGHPTILMSTWWQQVARQLEDTVNAILVIPEIQQALADLDTATNAASSAAAAAAAQAAAAQAAADMAAAAAADADANAAANAAAVAREQALVTSGINPTSVLTFDGTLIQIAAHTREYSDGTSVAVNAGSIGPGGTGVRYISYSDPMRAGGAVAYVRSTTNPTQGSDIHVVGAINVPATGTATGGQGPRRPGQVEP